MPFHLHLSTYLSSKRACQYLGTSGVCSLIRVNLFYFFLTSLVLSVSPAAYFFFFLFSPLPLPSHARKFRPLLDMHQLMTPSYIVFPTRCETRVDRPAALVRCTQLFFLLLFLSTVYDGGPLSERHIGVQDSRLVTFRVRSPCMRLHLGFALLFSPLPRCS